MTESIRQYPKTGFRKRLHRLLIPALAATLGLFAILTFVAVYAALHYNDEQLIDNEVEEISRSIVPGNRLRIQRYAWNEPHHEFANRRIDPFFVQIFNPEGVLLYASPNFSDPEAPQLNDALLESGAHTVRLDGTSFHVVSRPLRGSDATLLGHIQVTRFNPDHFFLIRWILLALAVLLVGSFLIWWVLMRRISASVTKPLHSISDEAKVITSQTLSDRITVPDHADLETYQLAGTLNNLLDRLEHSFDEMRHFTSHAAHELQTPLTLLLGNIEISLRRPRSPESYRDTLVKLQHEVNGMIDMVRRLLSLARLDRNAVQSEKTAFDLSNLVHRVAESFSPVANEKGIILKVDAPESVQIRGRESLVEDAIRNVVDNAVKYTKEGGISISLLEHDSGVHLEVQDTGTGISAEYVDRVKERFLRAPEAAVTAPSGSGLGLALVDEILKREGARWSIESHVGKGTTVHLHFDKHSRA